MKKLFFLFAAAALLTACSSDELSETTGGGGTPTNPTEEYASSVDIELENGTALSVSAVDKETSTRATDEGLCFVIDLNKLNDIMKELDDYKLKVDDFAIRIDGEYTNIKIENNNVQKWYMNVLSEQGLMVAVKHLDNLDFSNVHDYTYECYLWIENKKLLDDGSGSYGELLSTDSIKACWIGKDSWPVAEGEETGIDLSESIWKAYNEKPNDFFTSMEGGLLVRYNVYRGLQGRNGDTPYIKVSIHVEQQDQTTVGEKKNDCTWVSIPYTPHKSLSKDSSDILSVK